MNHYNCVRQLYEFQVRGEGMEGYCSSLHPYLVVTSQKKNYYSEEFICGCCLLQVFNTVVCFLWVFAVVVYCMCLFTEIVYHCCLFLLLLLFTVGGASCPFGWILEAINTHGSGKVGSIEHVCLGAIFTEVHGVSQTGPLPSLLQPNV